MTDNRKYKRAVRARMAETGEKYTQALRRIKEQQADIQEMLPKTIQHVKQEFEQTPVVPTISWVYARMIPRDAVEGVGWAAIVELQHEAAKRMAWFEGISAKRLGQAVRCDQASWTIGDDGEPIPHPADGTETWYSVRLCYEVQPEPGVDTSVTPVRQ